MGSTGTGTQLKAGAEARGFFFGPISPALFFDVFLTEGVNHGAAVETIQRRVLAARGAAGRGEEQKAEQAKRRKEESREDREPKRPRIEGSRENTPPLTEKDMFPELVGGTPFSS